MGQKRSLGAYLDVTVQQNQVLVTSKNGMQLQTLQMLSLDGCGDAGVIVADAPAQDGEGTIQLPRPLPTGSLLSVDVIASLAKQGANSVPLRQANDID